MTIPEHIEILRRGPRVWNAWRAENPSIVPDLEGIALSIGDRQLGPMNGGPINLSRALLADATLYFATLTGADMRGTDLTNADLRGARLEGVDLTGADLAGAQLDGASLSGAVLKAANLSGASLADVRDLTTDQIGEAEGNLGTVLPYDLPRPALWSVGQGILQIETARDAVDERQDEDTRTEHAPAEEPHVDYPTVEPAKPARMWFRTAAAPVEAYEPEQVSEPEEVPEPEAPQYVAAEPEVLPEPEPVQAQPVEMPAYSATPALPKVEAMEPYAAPDRFERQPASQPPRPAPEPMSMRSNGHEPARNDQGTNENKHVSWLVGGPRRVGREVRTGPQNWRDRA